MVPHPRRASVKRPPSQSRFALRVTRDPPRPIWHRARNGPAIKNIAARASNTGKVYLVSQSVDNRGYGGLRASFSYSKRTFEISPRRTLSGYIAVKAYGRNLAAVGSRSSRLTHPAPKTPTYLPRRPRVRSGDPRAGVPLEPGVHWAPGHPPAWADRLACWSDQAPRAAAGKGRYCRAVRRQSTLILYPPHAPARACLLPGSTCRT